jgi:hypothetical protein
VDGLNKNIAKDAFGYSLNYYAADYKPVGSIAAIDDFIASTANLNAGFGASIVGTGSTADAIRHTKNTGNLVGGSDHLIKGWNDLNGLVDLVNTGTLNASDLKIANKMIGDLKDALKGTISHNPKHTISEIK